MFPKNERHRYHAESEEEILGDLLDRADMLEYEASAALNEAEALHALAKRQAALAAELRSLALRISER